MTNFEHTKPTAAGLALIGKKGMAVEFTKIETGCGKYAAEEDISLQKTLKEKKQEFSITNAVAINDVSAEIKFVLTNKGLDTSYLFTEIGVYANDPDAGEILYAICFATPENADKMLCYNGLFNSAAIISLVVEITEGGDVIFNTSGIYALNEDLLAHIQNQDNPHGIKEMVGASSEKAGKSGLVPAPEIGDRDRFLRGDGTWAPVSSGGGYVASASAPENTSVLWIDTASGGVEKYFNGDIWTPILSVWS